MSKAVLLLNLGTPAEPTAKGLREFYKYFFADPFVFDMNPVSRWLLRHLIILPFRAPRTAKLYQSIWTKHGSPLKVFADRVQQSMQASFADEGAAVLVLNGMAYSEPFIHQAMAELEQKGVTDILVLPMFPQFSTATTASVFHAVEQAAKLWRESPQLQFVNDLFAEPAFIRAWSTVINKHLANADIDHVIFSYHGLPEQTIRKADSLNYCRFGDCCQQISSQNRNCYRAQCVATTESIVKALAWKEVSYSIAFQSRFGRQVWIQPYLDEHMAALVEKGVKKIAVITPSFVSDCLETTHEIGIQYRQQFLDCGGETLQLVPNLNDDPAWLSSIYEIARRHLQQSS
ncbi:MAG: ferrochelatase [Proteobacteria bacterium]|nr:ferrochelatase [Pseudomonadota bacterium]